MANWTRAALIGGWYDGGYVDLKATPSMIQIGNRLYSRIDDPDTGEYLGGYIDSGLMTTRLIPCPGGIPPWEAPEDGERLAYEGWAAWVELHGGFGQRLQLMTYQVETLAKVFSTQLTASAKSVVESLSKFIKATRPPG